MDNNFPGSPKNEDSGGFIFKIPHLLAISVIIGIIAASAYFIASIIK